VSARNLLHRNKYADFIAWLHENGYQHRAGKGMWQLQQVFCDGEWVPIYDRMRGDHLSIPDKMHWLVRRFINATGGAE